MTFVFDKDYSNNEQVRPFFEAYSIVRAELDARDAYPYNESFMGRIPEIEGPDEKTAIYLLQTMHALDRVRANVAAFLDEGGEPADLLDLSIETRATVAVYGYYMGGTGWQVFEGVRVKRDPKNGLTFKSKGQRAPRRFQAGNVLVKVAV